MRPLVDHYAFRRLDLQHKWYVSWLEIVENESPLTREFLPGEVLVTYMGDQKTDGKVFWDPSIATKKKTPVIAPETGDGDHAVVIDEEDASSDHDSMPDLEDEGKLHAEEDSPLVIGIWSR